jgi:CRP-like cAMP-binding protein
MPELKEWLSRKPEVEFRAQRCLSNGVSLVIKSTKKKTTDPGIYRPSLSLVHSVSPPKKRDMDIDSVFVTTALPRKTLTVPRKQVIFSQGDKADAVFYVQKGRVRLTVVSKGGKEATIGIVNEGYFFGEGSLAGQLLRMCSATAMSECQLVEVDKKNMMKTLHREPAFSDLFVAYLLTRNIRYEEDLIDQLFNYSEKRLARVLLLLAHFGKEGTIEAVIPKISQETIAEMIGSSRSRVNFFMNRFKRLGFIRYNGTLHVHSSLLSVVLHE